MSFDDIERSQAGGQKVFLYTWTRGSAVYRYAACDQDLVINFQRFQADGVINHGPIEQGGDPVRAGIDVVTASDHPVAMLYRSVPPLDTVMLLIQEVHLDDLASLRPVWQGRVVNARVRSQDREATLSHEPTYTSLKRMGLRRAYQTLCPLVTGGKHCGVNMEAFVLETTAQEIQGLDVTLANSAGRPDGYFLGGYVTYEIASGVIDRRNIRQHVGSVISLQGYPIGMVVGSALRVFPGDDHTAKTCAEKFNNIDNYGGFLYFPNKNPFGSSPVY